MKGNEDKTTVIIGGGAGGTITIDALYRAVNDQVQNPDGKTHTIKLIEKDLDFLGGWAYIYADIKATMLTPVSDITGCKEWLLERFDSLDKKDLPKDVCDAIKRRIEQDKPGVPRKFVGAYLKYLIDRAINDKNSKLKIELINAECIEVTPVDDPASGNTVEHIVVKDQHGKISNIKGDEYIYTTGQFGEKDKITDKIDKYFTRPYINPEGNLWPKLAESNNIMIVGSGFTGQEQFTSLMSKFPNKNIMIIYDDLEIQHDENSLKYWEQFKNKAFPRSKYQEGQYGHNKFIFKDGTEIKIDALIDATGFKLNSRNSPFRKFTGRGIDTEFDNVKSNDQLRFTNLRLNGSLLGANTFLKEICEIGNKIANESLYPPQIIQPEEKLYIQEFDSTKLDKVIELSAKVEKVSDKSTGTNYYFREIDNDFQRNKIIQTMNIARYLLNDIQIPQVFESKRSGKKGLLISDVVIDDKLALTMEQMIEYSGKTMGFKAQDNMFFIGKDGRTKLLYQGKEISVKNRLWTKLVCDALDIDIVDQKLSKKIIMQYMEEKISQDVTPEELLSLERGREQEKCYSVPTFTFLNGLGKDVFASREEVIQRAFGTKDSKISSLNLDDTQINQAGYERREKIKEAFFKKMTSRDAVRYISKCLDSFIATTPSEYLKEAEECKNSFLQRLGSYVLTLRTFHFSQSTRIL